jgi:hypothetical protein
MLVVTTLFVAVISGTAKTISSGKLTKNIEWLVHKVLVII